MVSGCVAFTDNRRAKLLRITRSIEDLLGIALLSKLTQNSPKPTSKASKKFSKNSTNTSGSPPSLPTDTDHNPPVSHQKPWLKVPQGNP
jgi:hypothetical protein